jgi:ribulose 1,5-bisphosphate synthetase/thiazole synthase
MRRKFEVVVAGGGPAGVIAAIAAARTGARTMLVEQNGFVGGLAVVGLPVHGFYNNREEQILKGIPWELEERLKKMDAAAEVRNIAVGPPRGRGGPKFNARWNVHHPEAFKYVALEMLREAGTELMVHTCVSDAVLEGDAVVGLVVENKSGRVVLSAERVVDCTGDGDVAARAGALFEKGQPADGGMQPMTPMFVMSGIDLDRAEQAGVAAKRPFEIVGSDFWRSRCRAYNVQLEGWQPELQQEIPEYGELLTQFGIWDFGDGVCYCGNMIHIPRLDASDGEDLSKAEFDGRRLVWQLTQFARNRLPGFEGSHLVGTNARIGVRETRRIMGDYCLTYRDVVEARRFDDVVTLCGYRVDIHGYDGGHKYHEPETGTQVKDYGAYDIPYRCLVPRRVENLLVAGRCISSDHIAHGSVRVQGTAMGMGHAAGTAAALSAQRGLSPRNLDARWLQETLLQQGAYLGDRFQS